jgi:2-polyprenyl-3-methyl-5-hydroxy-6-metoxy-1,4-benzoquinol methylase
MSDENCNPAQARSIMEFYDRLAPNYDAMTNFEQRFAQERPFFQTLIDRFHFRSALDAGCGSGFHSIVLSQLGVEVLGVDVSSEMLRLAEEHARLRNVRLRTLQGSFENLDTLIKERFAAVFVMGNSLAHLLSAADLKKVMQNFSGVLEPHGMLIIQTLNYDRILARREQIQNEKQVGTKTFVRSYDFDETGIDFHIVTREQKDDNAEEKTQTVRLRPVLHAELVALLNSAGFIDINAYGGISLAPFEPLSSKDLVVIASRKG